MTKIKGVLRLPGGNYPVTVVKKGTVYWNVVFDDPALNDRLGRVHLASRIVEASPQAHRSPTQAELAEPTATTFEQFVLNYINDVEPISRDAIAVELNATPQQVGGALSRLQKKHFIRRFGGGWVRCERK